MNGKNWFMIATMGTLLGYVVFFYPFIFNKQKEISSAYLVLKILFFYLSLISTSLIELPSIKISRLSILLHNFFNKVVLIDIWK